VKFKFVVVEVDIKEEEAIEIQYGTERCHVCFLLIHFVHGRRKEEMVKKLGKVLDLYKDSNDMTKQRKNRRLFDVASFHLLDDIQEME
jgi:hypothetical protein